MADRSCHRYVDLVRRDRSVVAAGRVGSAVACGTAALLLASMGGAVFAAPIIVPLLVMVIRRQRSIFTRAVGGVLLALTVGEVAWVLTYLTAGESQPWIWLLPALAVIVGSTAALQRQDFAAR